MHHKLKIYLLGSVAIELNGQPLAGLPSRAAEALLIYLLFQDRPVSRDVLAELLWADRSQKQALTNLRTILAALRRKLNDYLLVTRQTLGFDHSRPYWLDVAEFEGQLAQLSPQLQPVTPLTPDAAGHLRRALDFYRGEFLEGFSLREGPRFEEWVLLNRERLHRFARLGLRTIVAHDLASGNYQTGLHYAAQLLVSDPYDDQACQQMMWLLVRTGQRHAALAQYQRCRQVLATELGVEPGPEATRLYWRIRSAQTAHRINLPCFSTPFVGRDAELQQLSQYLADPHCRLLTLLGPGGIGKTRLAVEAASRYGPTLLHGACFVSLDSLDSLQSADLLGTTLATALNLSLDAMGDPRTQLLDALRAREILLILDNFEQLLPSQADDQSATAMNPALRLLIDILAAAPEVKLLITSRARLNLHEEWLYNVAGLAVPAEAEAETAITFSAVQLFVHTATRLRSDFSAREPEMAAIVRICRQVEGLPLAINLAAASTRTISCPEIAVEIERNLSFLRSSARNAPPRHRSIEAVFDYSWQLLSPVEQQILAQLTVFRGGFSAAAAMHVTPATPSILESLVDKSWLTLNPDLRYEYHELLRRYAVKKLSPGPAGQPSPAEIATRTRHAEYYTTFLHQQQPSLENEKQVEALAQVIDILDNVQAAWQWTVDQRLWACLGRALESLWRLYEIKNWFDAGEKLFGRAIDSLSGDVTEDAAFEKRRILAPLLIRQGWFCLRLARFEQARKLLTEALNLARHEELASETGRALHHLGLLEDSAGQYDQARQFFKESLAIYRASNGSHFDLGSALGSLGAVLVKMGRFDDAEPIIEEGIYHYLQSGDPRAIALMYSFLGGFAIQQGDYGKAKTLLKKGLPFQKKIDDQVMIRMSLAWLGEVHEMLAEYPEAVQQYEESLLISRGNGDRMGVVTALNNLGRVSVALDKRQQAGRYLREALTIAKEIQHTPVLIDGLISVAALLAVSDDKARAFEILSAAAAHPAASPQSKARAEQLLGTLGSHVSPGAESPPAPESLVDELLTEGSLFTLSPPQTSRT